MSAVVEHMGLVYRLVIAVDIANYSRLDMFDQSRIQARLDEVLARAARETGLDRADWDRQPRGDGELAVLPQDTDVAHVVAGFSARLAWELHKLRQSEPTEPRLRLRLAMHHGTMAPGRFGPVGAAPIVACRLLDAPVVRGQLTMSPDRDLVLVISGRLFDDVVLTRFNGLGPQGFQPFRVDVKGVGYDGYVKLVDGGER